MQAKLSSVCALNMGQSPSSAAYNQNADGLPFFQGNADFGPLYPKARVWCSAPVKTARSGDILFSVRAPIGAMNIANTTCCIGRGLAALTADESVCLRGYLWYALASKVEELNAKGTGSTFKAISKSVLAETEIPLPPLERQSRIAAALDRVSGLISLRREQLVRLDLLLRSRFAEMFGSVYDNRFGCDVRCLQDVCEPIRDGAHYTPEYTGDPVRGFKFLSSKDVTTGRIDWEHLKYIPAALHEKLYARVAPRRGDILLAKNGTTGIAAIVDRDEVFDIYVSLALLRPVGMEPAYLWAAVNAPETKRQFDAGLKGVGVPNLHLGEIKKTKILVPPLERQRQFAAFLDRTDRQRAAVRRALDLTETLKKTLMQEYFG